MEFLTSKGLNIKTQLYVVYYGYDLTTTQLFVSLSQRQISDSSKVKEFADDNFKFDES